MTDPGERNLTGVPCERCSHCRSKKDEPVFRDGGFVECKPPVEPSLWGGLTKGALNSVSCFPLNWTNSAGLGLQPLNYV